MKPPNDDSQSPDDCESMPPTIDLSRNADETNAFQNPLEYTVVPPTDSGLDKTRTLHNVENSDRTLDFTVSQSNKYQINIPGYELIYELGRGAMGVVYKARQVRADRIVALKVMINLDHARPEQIERFAVEAQASARLQHPNIVQVYDVSQTGQAPYFTQEFVPGGTLAKKISKQMLSHVDTAKVMLCLANAVAYAHGRKIVHRDLKPLNILLDDSGAPKIADFGLARRMEDQSHLTQDGTILGTPSYMAPEQASGDSNVIGPLSDVYSLGAILYELLTGRPPFKGATVWEVIQQVKSADPSPPSQLQAGIPADLETICLKCLQKDPAKRYESAKHLADDIQRHINNEPILARPIGQWERLVRLCKRNPREARLVGLVAGLLACFAIAAAVTAFGISQDRDQIAKQRDEISGQKDRIEKQRDEITKEKGISDNRLSLYRSTVSKMVNRVPRLLEDAPFGLGTRQELLSLIGGVLAESTETNVVGSSQKWGQQAVAIREGEIAWSSASGNQKEYKTQEELNAAFTQAADRFAEAERIALEVYESPEPDRAKAAANLASAKGRVAALAFEQDAANWKKCVPIYKDAMKLRREAIEAAPVPDAEPTAIRQAELADELQRYADFLIRAEPNNPNHINRALEVLGEAGDLLKLALADAAARPDIEETVRSKLALTLTTVANTQILAGDGEKVGEAFEAAIEQYKALIAKAPYRYVFLKNISECANVYGDYLLNMHADPNLIEQQYRLALDSIKQRLLTPTAKELERTGLAFGYYRIGLTLLRQNRQAEASQAFKQCEILRAKAYYDQVDELGASKTSWALVPFRLEWMTVQARLGMEAETLAAARELNAFASTATEADGAMSLRDVYLYMAASLGMLSSNQKANPANASKLENKAIELLEKAIAAGYQHLEYVRNDPDFDWLQNEPLMSRVKAMFDKTEHSE